MAVYWKEKFKLFSRDQHHAGHHMRVMHYHDTNELYFLESGKVTYFIDKEIYVANPGDFIFIPKNVFHKTCYSEDVPISRLILSFDSNFLGYENKELIEELSKQKHIQIDKSKSYKFESILRKLEDEDKYKEEKYLEIESLYLRLLIILILRYRINSQDSAASNIQKIIQETIDFININYSMELNLDFFAKKYSMSSGHFSKLFKKTTDVNLNEYINVVRITAAEKLLLNSNLSIEKISKKCGFNNSSYFAQVFKKLKGISPKKYSEQKHI